MGLRLRLNGSQTTSQWVSDYVSMGLRLRLNGSQTTSQWVSDYVSMGLRLRLNGSQTTSHTGNSYRGRSTFFLSSITSQSRRSTPVSYVYSVQRQDGLPNAHAPSLGLLRGVECS